jgi:hypothetical protein
MLVRYCMLFYVLLVACTLRDSKDETSQSRQLTKEMLAEGEKLSRRYCVQCHLYSPPELLPRKIWAEEVLPKMGAFHGIYQQKSRNELIEKGDAENKVVQRNVYPQQELIDSADWHLIKSFYLANAPDALLTESTDSLPVKDIFTTITPQGRISPPMTTMVDFKEASGLIYHSDVKKDVSLLNIYNADGTIVQSIAMRSPAAKIDEKSDGLWVLNMGSFTSTDAASGSLSRITRTKEAELYNRVEVVIDSLQRPCDVAYADFDQDKDEDVVIAQFGNWAGTLEWFENQGKDQYQRHTLLPITGAVKVKTEDVNGDGLVDILAMIAQGEESIFALLNQGSGKFAIKKLLQVPPTHGSVYFDYVDINGDGFRDILHVTGDNADYEAIPKPYHGIRIYKGNEDPLKFSEPYFIPQNGAYKAVPLDYDLDGDLDIASISFFPDYSGEAKESILILENNSNEERLNFRPFTLTIYDKGRWIDLDIGDLNRDGKPDLVVGSFVVQNPYGDHTGLKKSWMSNSQMFYILMNSGHY